MPNPLKTLRLCCLLVFASLGLPCPNAYAQLEIIAITGDAAPDGNGTFIFFNGAPALNVSGQTAFSGSLVGTTGGGSDDTGLFLGGPTGGVTQIIREGDAAPITVTVHSTALAVPQH